MNIYSCAFSLTLLASNYYFFNLSYTLSFSFNLSSDGDQTGTQILVSRSPLHPYEILIEAACSSAKNTDLFTKEHLATSYLLATLARMSNESFSPPCFLGQLVSEQGG